MSEKKLSEKQLKVLREKATEPAFSGKLLNNKTKGTYNCAYCGNHLFPSDVKFDSGTGWPSFNDAFPNSIKLKEDNSHGMSRTEVLCSNCGSHLGHLFNDAQSCSTSKNLKTNKRYCINSLALDFKKS
jgi:peptide-methionine (R)-S-oxide reductase